MSLLITSNNHFDLFSSKIDCKFVFKKLTVTHEVISEQITPARKPTQFLTPFVIKFEPNGLTFVLICWLQEFSACTRKPGSNFKEHFVLGFFSNLDKK